MRMIAAGLMLAILGTAAPSAAMADEAGDLAAVKACVETAGETARSCVGSIDAACQGAFGRQVTSEEALACTARETGAWDALLNERYERELAFAAQVDKDFAAAGDTDARPVEATLRDAQRAWIAFRDAECQRRYDLFQNGSYRDDAKAGCLLDLTADRALDILASES